MGSTLSKVVALSCAMTCTLSVAVRDGQDEAGKKLIAYVAVSEKPGGVPLEAGTVNVFSCPTNGRVKVGVTATHVLQKLIEKRQRTGLVIFEENAPVKLRAFLADQMKEKSRRTVDFLAEGIDPASLKVSTTADLTVFGFMKVGGGGKNTKDFLRDLVALDVGNIAAKPLALNTETRTTTYGSNDYDGMKDTGIGVRRSSKTNKGLLYKANGPAKIDNQAPYEIGMNRSFGDTMRLAGIDDTRTCKGDSGSLLFSGNTIVALVSRIYGKADCVSDANVLTGAIPLDAHKRWIEDQITALCPAAVPAPQGMLLPPAGGFATVATAASPSFSDMMLSSPIGCHLSPTEDTPSLFLTYDDYRRTVDNTLCRYIPDCTDDFNFSGAGNCFIWGN